MRHSSPFILTRPFSPVMLSIACFLFPALGWGLDYEQAHSLVLQKKWAQVFPLLKSLNEEAPSSSLIGYDYAQTLLRLNRREEAIQLFKKFGFQLEADTAKNLFLTQDNLKTYQEGIELLNQNELSASCSKLEKVLEQDKRNGTIEKALAQCLVLSEKNDSAIRLLDAHLTFYGDEAEALLWKGRALAQSKKLKDALPILIRAHQKLPQLEISSIWLSEAYLSLRQASKAMSVLEGDVSHYPEHLYSKIKLYQLILSSPPLSPSQLKRLRDKIEEADGQLKSYQPPLGLRIDPSSSISQSIEELRKKLKNLTKKQPASYPPS